MDCPTIHSLSTEPENIMKTDKIANLKAFIANLNGRFFTVDFRKKDGSYRTINGRTGVVRYLKNGNLPNNNGPEALIVYSIHDKGYRTVNLDTIHGIRANNMVIMIDDKVNALYLKQVARFSDLATFL